MSTPAIVMVIMDIPDEQMDEVGTDVFAEVIHAVHEALPAQVPRRAFVAIRESAEPFLALAETLMPGLSAPTDG